MSTTLKVLPDGDQPAEGAKERLAGDPESRAAEQPASQADLVDELVDEFGGELAGDAADKDPAERRAHQRIQVLLEVDYRADDTFLFAYITDISAMGIFVRTAQPETPGTRIFLRFTPPATGDQRFAVEITRVEAPTPLELEGEVIWINPPRDEQYPRQGDDSDCHNPGMGIRFVELADEQRDSIMELVRTFAYLDDAKPEN